MITFFQKTKTYAIAHKKTSILVLILLLIAGYYLFKNLTSTAGDTTYVLGEVGKGTIVASITGSGQVSTDHTLDLKPQASGNVVYVAAKAGQQVHRGDLLVELDATTAQKSVRDAQANLESAQLSLKKLQEPTDALSLLQAQNALTQAKADLAKAYNDGFGDVSNTFLDLPSIMTGLDATLHNSDLNTTSGQQNISFYGDSARQLESNTNTGKADQYTSDTAQKFQNAKAAYDKTFADYKNMNSGSPVSDIQTIIDETYTTTKNISDAVQSASNLIQYYQDTLTSTGRTPNSKSNTALTSLNGYVSKLNSDISNLLSIKTTLTSDTTSIPEKQASLDKLQSGTDSLDLQSSQLNVTKAENALQDAKDTLDNYYIRAPFDGTVAAVDVKVGDPASGSAAVATLIADGQVVDIPLNEVDVSKVKTGDKVTLTFDAIDSLTLTGKVASIDTVGTVTQGVVNYTVTISLDTTDPRVKPGMSTTASIITEVHQDVLTIATGAVKTTANGSYVLAFDTPPTTKDAAGNIISAIPPKQIPVSIGISDDTNTEIISGLTEGQSVVVRSIAPSTASTSSAPSLLGGGTNRTAASGGALRAVRTN